MGQGSSLTSMVLIIGHCQRGDADDGFYGADVDGILVEVDMAAPVSIDVLPGLRGVEMQFFWRDADD